MSKVGWKSPLPSGEGWVRGRAAPPTAPAKRGRAALTLTLSRGERECCPATLHLSLAAPRGLAARLILEDDALRRQLVADAVGGGEVTALASCVATGYGVLDRRPARIVALIALQPSLRILLEESEEIAGGDE